MCVVFEVAVGQGAGDSNANLRVVQTVEMRVGIR